MNALRRFYYEFTESFIIASAQIRANKTRSLLTALGVIIGILAVTMMGTAINGIDKGFDRSLAMIGYDVLYVQKWPWSKVDDWWNYRNRRPIKTEYAEQMKKIVDASANTDIEAIVPQSVGGKSVKYGENQISGTFVIGTTDEFPLASTVDLQYGRFFNAIESRGARQVCVVGYDVAVALFPSALAAIDQTIQVEGVACKIIGVSAKQGKFLGLFSWDSNVVMPLTVFKKYYGTSRNDRIVVKIKDKNRVEEAKGELTSVMRRVRGLQPDQKDDFNINEQQAFKSTLDPIKSGIAFAGLFITGLSLFVGAIGIMNITFVSVKERTKEIGTRKALGARRRTILMQFLIEAVSICALGGLVGLAIAYGLSAAIGAAFPSFPTDFSFNLVFTGMIAAILTGVISGFAPAYSASKLDPVVALRYE